MVQVDDELPDAVAEEAVDGPGDEGLVADGDQRLRERVGDGPHARAVARGEDHGAHLVVCNSEIGCAVAAVNPKGCEWTPRSRRRSSSTMSRIASSSLLDLAPSIRSGATDFAVT